VYALNRSTHDSISITNLAKVALTWNVARKIHDGYLDEFNETFNRYIK
jgi:hypothetical protein